MPWKGSPDRAAESWIRKMFLSFYPDSRICIMKGKMPGFNTEIMHKGILYMVQTQDLSPNYTSIETTIYKKGRLVQRRRFDYAELLGNPDFRARRDRLMEELHQKALQDFREGKMDPHS